jgi:hypothetical protein
MSARLRAPRWRRLVLAAVGTGAAVGIVALAMPSSRGVGAVTCRTTFIPAYMPPDGLARLAQRPLPGRVVIINPSNGPGDALEPAYRDTVAAAQRAGTRVLGYVHTGYGSRDAATATADVARYRSWYGVDGIFFDEAAHDDARLAYYRTLAADARAAGARLVAVNPGTVPARGYFDVADIVVTFEGAYSDYAPAVQAMPAWVRELPGGRVANLVYDASREQALQAAGDRAAGFLYATSSTLPNPWSTLPSYLDELEAAVGGCP